MRAAADKPFSPVDPEAEKVKILLVDDQPDNLLSVGAVLECLGEELVTAESGTEALRHLLQEDFAVIVLDVMMPGMDGFETAALIRQRERSRHTPIIFLTALGRSEQHEFHGYDLGAVDYIVKPVMPLVLRSKVAVFVDLARKRRLLERQSALLASRNEELEQALAEKKKAEDEILVLNRHLERQLQEITAVNRELEAFSYSVSHDLRGPLSRILGFSQALLESAVNNLDDTGRLYLNRIHTSATRVCQLVDALLNLGRLSRAELRREMVDLTAMAQGIANELQTREPQRRVVFHVQDGLSAMGDASLLRIALLNLIENAWKFTRNQPDARVEVAAADQDSQRVYFVRDNGAGFDVEQRDKLFKPFQRLHPHTDFEGTGVGLATVDRIVQRHGGRIWAESVLGSGATFYFTCEPR